MGKKKGAEAAAEVASPADSVAEAAPPAKEKKAASKARAPKGEKPAAAAAAPPAAAPEAQPAKTAPALPTPAAPSAPAPAAEMVKKKRKPGKGAPRGKKLKNRLKQLADKIAKSGPLPLKQALALLKENKRAKFDETVEIHMALGVDAKQSDQMIRGAVPLPYGIGKSVRLLVFAQGDNAAKAREAGADHVGADDLAKQIQGGWFDFDVALATQDMMGVVGRLGKVLGPRGLMPSPKAGTVITGDVAAAVREFKMGKVEFRTDAGGNVHAPIGKLSFDLDKLVGNANAFIEQIRASKPAAVKGNFIRSITVSATMSPGVPVSA